LIDEEDIKKPFLRVPVGLSRGGKRPWLNVGVISVGAGNYALELACIQKDLTNPSLLAVRINKPLSGHYQHEPQPG
jgi:hypothetical protein